ncbi:MAG: Holliday junction branch migration DNA helicase RuvB [Oligoflexales bacterium]|nr:Holliday junction branch migration DNA helicase RuvB [Oligoflexales bacterium]
MASVEAHDDDRIFERVESKIRPDRFIEYPGQKNVKGNLQIYVKAALQRNQPLDHILLHGPPGLGKTTLARIIANELGVAFYQTSGPSIEKSGDLVGILAGIEEKGVIFIDEIHRLSITVEEILYSAMEDFSVDILIGQGPTARISKMPINPFTLIGATTRVALLSGPLVSRFGIKERLEYYDDDSLVEILQRSSRVLDIDLSQEGAYELARRSRGTPRIANRLLRRVRDFADCNGIKKFGKEIIKLTLSRLEIDIMGLDQMDRKILSVIRDHYSGGPVGLETLSATIGEDRTTIEDVYEPFLLNQGFLIRGPRGREITTRGLDHLTKAGI